MDVSVTSGSATAQEAMTFREDTCAKSCFKPNRRWMELGVGAIIPKSILTVGTRHGCACVQVASETVSCILCIIVWIREIIRRVTVKRYGVITIKRLNLAIRGLEFVTKGVIIVSGKLYVCRYRRYAHRLEYIYRIQ